MNVDFTHVRRMWIVFIVGFPCSDSRYNPIGPSILVLVSLGVFLLVDPDSGGAAAPAKSLQDQPALKYPK